MTTVVDKNSDGDECAGEKTERRTKAEVVGYNG